ncbi:MAG: DUF2147 domain-containing protein [Pseudomonadota bacterium]
MLKAALFAGVAAVAATPALADPSGLWQTETSDSGAYLRVQIGPCGYDQSKLCGQIVEAVNATRNDLIGRAIITGMQPTGADRWGKGQIWAPDDDRNYSSKMSLQGGTLKVEGCFAIFCRGQNWTRVDGSGAGS